MPSRCYATIYIHRFQSSSSAAKGQERTCTCRKTRRVACKRVKVTGARSIREILRRAVFGLLSGCLPFRPGRRFAGVGIEKMYIDYKRGKMYNETLRLNPHSSAKGRLQTNQPHPSPIEDRSPAIMTGSRSSTRTHPEGSAGYSNCF